MTNNPPKSLLSFLHLQFFISHSSEGNCVSDGHSLNQSSEATQPSPPSPTQTTPPHHPINQEREESFSPLVPTKEDHISINIDSNFPSSSSTSLLSNADQVPLPQEHALPCELKTHLPGLPISTPGRETSPRSQEDLVTPSQALNPVFDMVRGQELGRHVLVLVIPIVIFLITTSNPLNMSIYFTLPVILLCIGFMVIWNGIVLRRVFRHASNWIEIIGISLVLLAFYGIIARFLPGYAAWIPFLCWVLTLIPFIVAVFSKKKDGNGQPGGASNKSSVPLLPLQATSCVNE